MTDSSTTVQYQGGELILEYMNILFHFQGGDKKPDIIVSWRDDGILIWQGDELDFVESLNKGMRSGATMRKRE